VTDTGYLPRIGINTAQDSSGGIRVLAVAPGTSGAEAGLRAGDVLVGISQIDVSSPDAFQQFRDQYGSREGADITYRIVRDGQPMSLPAKVRLATNITQRIEVIADAPAKAQRVRHGIFSGTTAR
jgi:S1-C subfamily serine protease